MSDNPTQIELSATLDVLVPTFSRNSERVATAEGRSRNADYRLTLASLVISAVSAITKADSAKLL